MTKKFTRNYLIHENQCQIDDGEGKYFYAFLGIAILGLIYPLLSILEGGFLPSLQILT